MACEKVVVTYANFGNEVLGQPPRRPARINQSQIDRGNPKNPDYYGLLGAFLGAVVMRRVGDA